MEFPENVVAIAVRADGTKEYTYSEFPIQSRWPGILVNSEVFRRLPAPSKLYEQATAFLESARLLCEIAGSTCEKLVWSKGSVCYYCLNIATELFLKACILKSSHPQKVTTHNIPRLMKAYRQILPNKEFNFVTPFEPSLKEVEELIGRSIGSEVDHHPDQLFRYGTGLDGNGSAAIHQFSPDYFYSYVVYLSEIWHKAWMELSK
jgi:hypothetical protein